MKIKISSVAEKGVIGKERLILKVIAGTDVGDFVLLQTDYGPQGAIPNVHQAYWFPFKQVSGGDLVVVYTKSGTDSEKELAMGKKAHFFYWGLPSAIWNHVSRAAVLLHAPEWESKTTSEL